MSKGYIRNRTRAPRQHKDRPAKKVRANRAEKVVARSLRGRIATAIKDSDGNLTTIRLNCLLTKGSIKRALNKLGYNCRARAITIP